MGGYQVPVHTRLARMLMRPLFRGIFHMLSQVKIYGLENVPRRGAYIIAINHISIYEPPFMLAFWPVAPEAVGAVDIWERRGQATLARLYGGIQVHRGQYDRKLLETILATLQSGRPVLIAPEGGRSHLPGMRKALPGVAYIIDQASVPVVPVGVVGTTSDFFSRATRGERPKLEMNIGQPVNLPPVGGKGQAKRAARQENADIIMRQIACLLPEEYRGVYACQTANLSQTKN
jgi:1-acyl-sn-glycerol-3-phosphate acyltransferase